MKLKKLGLIINPWAGVGGPAGLKGSDGAETVARALQAGIEPQSHKRAAVALHALQPFCDALEIVTFAGDMGEALARELGFPVQVVGAAEAGRSTPDDTEAAAKAIRAAGADLIVFAGGDGTARNMVNALGDGFPVLGIPAGVKMHSACFAISPKAGGEVLRRLMAGELVDLHQREVRDIDEKSFREGRVSTRYYGELLVPEEGHFLQAVKNAGREVEELAVADIAAEIVEEMDEQDPDTLYIFGPGSTTLAVLSELGAEGTLLGVDLWRNGALVAADVNAVQIQDAITSHRSVSPDNPVRIVLTAIGGQGHLIGRGNQQLTPSVLQTVGRDNLMVVATKTKITELGGRPLLVDSGDPSLDEAWSGFIPVVTGYRDEILYPLSGDGSGQSPASAPASPHKS
ncbi:ATP-NAD kinase family protein [Microbulbifer hydrolyticus]|uniref:ATP-NAD kinase n=1 Tax=Microbulbifer hydrolyticus TaxID=48074 RepID=A0A6P1TD14_9GAMM|nr:ATP-NAD kinase family protein [Microbulbifer hydrolyticus]MBB5212019.1 putative polyphosphate/ATP-dependent NAD kinase [Microbulbifer hydrolyticus]QHQ39701.1 ATP-NAD kinase [Microbulbifer hydrolyticus]